MKMNKDYLPSEFIYSLCITTCMQWYSIAMMYIYLSTSDIQNGGHSSYGAGCHKACI